MTATSLMQAAERACGLCGREARRNCWQGEMQYDDGSSRVCPNWNKRLDEVGGMTPEEADQEHIYRSQFR